MENTPRTRVKSHFYFSSALPKMVSFSIKISPLCDTCDSKKLTSLLEGARVRSCVKQKTWWGLFCHLHYAKQGRRKIFCHFFLDFSLFGAISTPYTYRGWLGICCHMCHGRNRENNERTMKRGSEGVAKIREKVRERKREWCEWEQKSCIWTIRRSSNKEQGERIALVLVNGNGGKSKQRLTPHLVQSSTLPRNAGRTQVV